MNEQILEMLREDKGYVSGEEISRRLGISRTAVWKSIKALREYGYHITSSTNKGYHLEKDTDILEVSVISRDLNTGLIGKEIIVLKETDSTNSELKRRASKGGISGLVAAAEKQTDGKGRFGRNWDSQEGGLYFSVLLRPDMLPSDASAITLAAGLGVCLAIREYTGIDAKIKWPNDIIVGNRKLCGILTEMAAQIDRVDFIIIGIGINVNNRLFPEEISEKASSLFLETQKMIDRNDFFRCVLQKIDKVISSFLVSLSVEDMDMFKGLCATLGRKVSFTRYGNVIEGTAKDISLNGELIVSDDSGKEYSVSSGEVTVQGIY